MAKQVAKKKTKTNSANNEQNKMVQRWIMGLFIFVIGLYILATQVSFFFTWKSDQAIVEWSTLAEATENVAENVGGHLGAILANQMITKWFGFFAIAIPIIMIIVALRIMRYRPTFLRKSVRVSVVVMIIGSVALAYLCNNALWDWTVFGSGPGGMHGIFISQWLNTSLGYVGAGLVIFLAIVLLAVYININTINILNKVGKGVVDSSKKVADMSTAMVVKGIDTIQSKHTENDDKEDVDSDESPFVGGDDEIVDDNFLVERPGDEPSIDTYQFPNSKAVEEELKAEVDENGFLVYDAPGSKPPKENKYTDDERFEVVIPDYDNDFVVIDPSKAQGGDTELIIDRFKDDQIINDEDIDLEFYDHTRDLYKYSKPPVELLEDHKTDVIVSKEELDDNKNKIISTLENFGIKIDKIKATIGPTVTLYEIIPAAGVRISKIKNLEDDIALSLAALGIRIIAPMPGKGTIGIEVPNKNPEVVSMYSVVKTVKFQESNYELPLVLGKTIQNETFVADLAKMPHLLVAGATGQGKSVGLNAILTSLIYKKHPSEVKFVLIDPKKVELSVYAKLEKHFLAKLPGEDEAIITDTQKVIYTLNSLCIEMENRYTLLQKAAMRNVKEYNEKFTKKHLNPNNGHRYLPYIVVVVDEFADMIMTAGKEVERPLTLLAQKSRAIGIHLVIATQRPTTNIITGIIKANFPTRIAFRVISMIDSRTILDQPGANQLIGRGDMLISSAGGDLVRVQCAFVDTPEVERVVAFVGNQQGYPCAYELPEYVPEIGDGGSGKDVDLHHRDSMFEQVARMVVNEQQGSTSSIQRKFSIGYNRAGRIMDQLESAGIVGRVDGSKPREVLIQDLMTLERVLTSIDMS